MAGLGIVKNLLVDLERDGPTRFGRNTHARQRLRNGSSVNLRCQYSVCDELTSGLGNGLEWIVQVSNSENRPSRSQRVVSNRGVSERPIGLASAIRSQSATPRRPSDYGWTCKTPTTLTTDKWGRVCRLNRSANSPNRENDRDSLKPASNMAIGWLAEPKAIRRTVLLDFDRKGMMIRMLAIVTTMPLFGRGVL